MGWSRPWKACLLRHQRVPFLHETQVFRHQLCSDTSEAQIINQNVLSGYVSNVELLCNLSNGQFAAYGHPPFDFVDVFVSFRRRRPATAFVILDRLTTTSEAFVPAEKFDLVRISLPKHFSNISKVCAPLNLFLTQNLMQTRCCKVDDIFFVKNRNHT